jgi:hypothetical protein
MKNYFEWQDECGDIVFVDAHISEIESGVFFAEC